MIKDERGEQNMYEDSEKKSIKKFEKIAICLGISCVAVIIAAVVGLRVINSEAAVYDTAVNVALYGLAPVVFILFIAHAATAVTANTLRKRQRQAVETSTEIEENSGERSIRKFERINTCTGITCPLSSLAMVGSFYWLFYLAFASAGPNGEGNPEYNTPGYNTLGILLAIGAFGFAAVSIISFIMHVSTGVTACVKHNKAAVLQDRSDDQMSIEAMQSQGIFSRLRPQSECCKETVEALKRSIGWCF
jgi:nitrate reductase NapE component